MFLGIELATTPTYVWAAGDLVRHAGDKMRSWTRKLGAQAVAATSFAAPYGYLAVGGAMDSYQGATVAGGLLTIGAVPAIGRFVKKVRQKRKIEDNK